MGELLANFLKDLVENLSKDWVEAFSLWFMEFLEKDWGKLFRSWLEVFAPLLTILTISGKWVLSSAVLDGIARVAEILALRFMSNEMANDPQVQEATSEMSAS